MAATKTKTAGVPVSTRALYQRINRELAKEGMVLKAARGERARSEVGDYFVLDTGHNTVVVRHVDLEKYGRELGVLAAWERVIG
jgi:hypothetical protein